MDLPIVVVAYNRENTLKRILSSLSNALINQNVKLYISIDGHGKPDVLEIAENFQWKHGDKQIISHSKNLGLRDHILSCGNLALQHDGIIVFEDDLYVSPFFYDYVVDAVDFYKNDESIAGISLYSHCYSETAQYPFYPLADSHDVFFLQLASSWGQCWTSKQWSEFKSWYDKFAGSYHTLNKKLPPSIETWPESSWKKYFIKYMIDKNLFFVYPGISLCTNFGDQGVHHVSDNHYQTALLWGKKAFGFTSFDASFCKYDAYCEILPSCLKKLTNQFNGFEFDVDLYGSKPLDHLLTNYVLTSRGGKNAIMGFDRKMIPHEANVIAGIDGSSILFCKKEDVVEQIQPYNNKRTVYFHRLPRWHIK